MLAQLLLRPVRIAHQDRCEHSAVKLAVDPIPFRMERHVRPVRRKPGGAGPAHRRKNLDSRNRIEGRVEPDIRPVEQFAALHGCTVLLKRRPHGGNVVLDRRLRCLPNQGSPNQHPRVEGIANPSGTHRQPPDHVHHSFERGVKAGFANDRSVTWPRLHPPLAGQRLNRLPDHSPAAMIPRSGGSAVPSAISPDTIRPAMLRLTWSADLPETPTASPSIPACRSARMKSIRQQPSVYSGLVIQNTRSHHPQALNSVIRCRQSVSGQQRQKKFSEVSARLFRVSHAEVLSDAVQGDHIHFELITATVRLNDGTEGTGCTCTGGKGSHAVRAMIRHAPTPMLMGGERDPVEQLHDQMLVNVHQVARGGIASFAVSAIDTALRDLRCRSCATLSAAISTGDSMR